MSRRCNAKSEKDDGRKKSAAREWTIGVGDTHSSTTQPHSPPLLSPVHWLVVYSRTSRHCCFGVMCVPAVLGSSLPSKTALTAEPQRLLRCAPHKSQVYGAQRRYMCMPLISFFLVSRSSVPFETSFGPPDTADADGAILAIPRETSRRPVSRQISFRLFRQLETSVPGV